DARHRGAPPVGDLGLRHVLTSHVSTLITNVLVRTKELTWTLTGQRTISDCRPDRQRRSRSGSSALCSPSTGGGVRGDSCSPSTSTPLPLTRSRPSGDRSTTSRGVPGGNGRSLTNPRAAT